MALKKDPNITLIRVLTNALKDAHEHLEFIGYGDSYEREGWRILDKEIINAIQKGEEYLKQKHYGTTKTTK